jgi:hypothetical protein
MPTSGTSRGEVESDDVRGHVRHRDGDDPAVADLGASGHHPHRGVDRHVQRRSVRREQAGGDRARHRAHRVAARHRREAALLEDDDAEVRPGGDRRQDQHRAQSGIAPGLVQQQGPQPLQVLPAVCEPLRHRVAVHQRAGVDDDAPRLALGVHLDGREPSWREALHAVVTASS